MNKERRKLVQKLIDINYELLDLTDEQLSVVFLTDDYGKEQRTYTKALIEGLELALDHDYEITASIRSLAHLLTRKNLTIEEALEIEEKQSKSGCNALGVHHFMKMDFSYIDKYCKNSNGEAILTIPTEEWNKIPEKTRKQVETSKWFLGRREETGDYNKPFNINIEGLTKN